MADTTPNSSKYHIGSEDYYLKQASVLAAGSARNEAIVLLEEARRILPVSNKLLNALGKLYLSVGKAEQAARCFQSVLNREVLSDPDIGVDLPIADDMAYLDEQSQLLDESEYSIETPDFEEATPRTVLSLGASRKPEQGPKIIVKNRSASSTRDNSDLADPYDTPKLCSDDNPATVGPTPESTAVLEPKQTAKAGEDLREGGIENPENIESIQKSEIEEENKESEADVQSYAFELQPYGDQIADFEELTLDENQGDECESSDYSNVLYEIDNYDRSESIEEASQEDWELAIYDHWEDDSQLDEEADEDEVNVLKNLISREDRAKQAAVESLLMLGWNISSLPLVTEVFIALGWNNAKRAFEREAQAGASCDELYLAFQIKQLWSECDRYWISLSSVWALSESTTAIYRHCSWPQALRLVRVFQDLPDIEEIIAFIESEFDYWYGSLIIKSRFPSFNKYLFNYRLNKSLPTIHIGDWRRFGADVAVDAMDATWSRFALSDEMASLRTRGIDLFQRHATRNYYYSDIPFDPRELDAVDAK